MVKLGERYRVEELVPHRASLCLLDAIDDYGQDWLRAALAQPFAGTTVVVTHFAPSLRSADPRYGVTPATAGFCNSLQDLMVRARFWLHGHLHCQHDYVEAGCRVVANTLGYAKKGEQEAFRETFVLDLAASPVHV